MGEERAWKIEIEEIYQQGSDISKTQRIYFQVSMIKLSDLTRITYIYEWR